VNVDVLERAKQQRWYHTLELRPGEWTDGWFDLRPAVRHYGLPEDMSGMRVLEVGPWDGFWSFEMEKRGAEVLAIDLDDERELDWPPRFRPTEFPDQARGSGFELAKEILGSSVKREVCSIYDATPERFGTFDLVFCGTVLIHLRDQMLALQRIAALCDDLFISTELYDRLTSLLPISVARFQAHRKQVEYWRPNIKCWQKMIWAAGFDRVERHAKFKMQAKGFKGIPNVVIHAHRE
jgi:tRNA (mo5U34)-methyltransferase